MAVPTQSVPVSPPPITMTFLPAAEIGVVGPPSRALVFATRKSMAKCTPASSRPSTFRSRGIVEPTARTAAS
jgi:hypothetical protein